MMEELRSQVMVVRTDGPPGLAVTSSIVTQQVIFTNLMLLAAEFIWLVAFSKVECTVYYHNFILFP